MHDLLFISFISWIILAHSKRWRIARPCVSSSGTNWTWIFCASIHRNITPSLWQLIFSQYKRCRFVSISNCVQCKYDTFAKWTQLWSCKHTNSHCVFFFVNSGGLILAKRFVNRCASPRHLFYYTFESNSMYPKWIDFSKNILGITFICNYERISLPDASMGTTRH